MTSVFYTLQPVMVMGLSCLGLYLMWSKRYTVHRLRGCVLLLAGIALFFVSPQQKIQWDGFEFEDIEAAGKQNQSVFLYVAADWCYPCYQLERQTFTDKRLLPALENFAKIKLDVSDMKSPVSEEILKAFKINAVPEILVLNARGELFKRIHGFVTAETLIDAVNGLTKMETDEKKKSSPVSR